MLCGRRTLKEVPHLVVAGAHGGTVSDNEILVFFGEHAGRVTERTWRDFVINWQAPREQQLERRDQHNMGELLGKVAEMLDPGVTDP
jgi:hypothetical protein